MSTEKKKRVVVAGATGLVGASLVKLLAGRSDIETIALVREARPGRFDASVTERVFDYESDASYRELGALAPDAIICCLGTTRAKAGSDEAFRRVDADYPKRLIDAAKSASSKPVFGLVSSVGAGSPRGLYLKTKAEVESALSASGLRYAVVRPSFLLGDRAESRIGEKIGIVTLGPLLSGLGAISTSLKRYAPIHADEVARALVRLTVDDPGNARVVEGKQLFEAGRA
jgi:uncharacterized protein YbjT (DUF2867 family)